VEKIDEFKFPVSRPDDVSYRPDTHLSTVPSVRTTCSFRPDSPLYREASIQIASVRTFPQHVWTPLSTRTVSDSFQVPRKGRSINRPDDVVSYPVWTSDSLGPDSRATNMEIADSTLTVRTSASHGRDALIANMEIAC
jgi:hypothetical protein